MSKKINANRARRVAMSVSALAMAVALGGVAKAQDAEAVDAESDEIKTESGEIIVTGLRYGLPACWWWAPAPIAWPRSLAAGR